MTLTSRAIQRTLHTFTVRLSQPLGDHAAVTTVCCNKAVMRLRRGPCAAHWRRRMGACSSPWRAVRPGLGRVVVSHA
jgi:hypothetical protein